MPSPVIYDPSTGAKDARPIFPTDDAFASGAVQSGKLGPASVNNPNIADQAVSSGELASGQIGSVHIRTLSIENSDLGNGIVTSGKLASGAIGSIHIQDGTIISGDIASGAIGTNHLASGALNNLNAQQFVAGELISGIQAVNTKSGGRFLQVAMAGISGRMPAMAVVDASGGISSGDPVPKIYFHGLVDFKVASGFGVILNGTDNQRSYVARSGTIQTNPPTNSGALVQTVLTPTSSGFVVNIDPSPVAV